MVAHDGSRGPVGSGSAAWSARSLGPDKTCKSPVVARHGNSGDSTDGADRSLADPEATTPVPVVLRRLRRYGPWLVGFAVAVVMLGPALAPGPLFNLDLVLPPQVPVPRGVWGLGPELPRRVPMWLLVAWLSPIIGGDTAGKALMAGSIVVAFVGAYRLAMGEMGTRRASPPVARTFRVPVVVGYGAGLLYAANPFLLTRLDVGHLMIVVPMAILPWVLPTLLRPADNIRMTFLAALLLGFAGHYGGAITLMIVAAGLVATRGRRAGKVVAVTVLAQLPWLVPGLIVYSEGASIVDSTPFATYVEGPQGAGQLLAGHGFWQPNYQVGYPGGWAVAVVGVVLAALAIYGSSQLPASLRRPMAVLAGLGFLAAVASATPGLADAYVSLSRNPIGSVVREGQRLLPLYLVWMAPAAALGAHRVASMLAAHRGGWRGAAASVADVVPLVAALWLASAALWGIDPKLRPVELPPEYAQARQHIIDQPGPVVALPWHQYFNLEADSAGAAEGNRIIIRRVLNPLPLYLGGDVLMSSDPELRETDRRERVDPRERQVDAIVADAKQAQPVSARLAKLGVRWVILLHEVDWLTYSGVTRDPGLRSVVRGPALELYEVTGWKGAVVDEQGQPVANDPVIEPVLRVDPSGPAVYNRPAASGWMRGWEAAGTTPEGLVSLPAGSGLVWYWPSLVVVATTFATYLVAIWSLTGLCLDLRRRRAIDSPAEQTHSGPEEK
jgi:hypothetical protein